MKFTPPSPSAPRTTSPRTGSGKVVIGLSGGIDSALVATIAVDALGKENVVGVTLPSRFNSTETRKPTQNG
jgi:NAD+ synthase (glutamine-hydrolysing)